MVYLCWVVLCILIFSLEAQDSKICEDPVKGTSRCCSDYKNVSGTCEPCYGSYGIDCENVCQKGFYGHGCKTACHCKIYERCDRIYGCVANNITICNITGNECCTDYYRKSSESKICQPCIGSMGHNCSKPCEFGFFGHGCREKCNCSSDTHWCDAKVGCINHIGDQGKHTNLGKIEDLHIFHLVLMTVGSAAVTSLIWIVLYVVSRQRKRNLRFKAEANIQDDLVTSPPRLSSQQIESHQMAHVNPNDLGHSSSHEVRSLGFTENSGFQSSCLLSPFQDKYTQYNRHNDNHNHPVSYENASIPKNVSSTRKKSIKGTGPKILERHRPYSSVKYNRKTRDREEESPNSPFKEKQLEATADILYVDKDVDEVYGFNKKYVQNMRTSGVQMLDKIN